MKKTKKYDDGGKPGFNPGLPFDPTNSGQGVLTGKKSGLTDALQGQPATIDLDPNMDASMQQRAGRAAMWNHIFDHLGQGINMALMATDAALPADRNRRPAVPQLQSYNPTAYGTGSQAIAADGALLSDGGDPVKDLHQELPPYKAFYNNYLNSPNYKDRLQKQGYTNPSAVIKDRQNTLKQIQAYEIPGMESQYFRDSKTININPDQLQMYDLSRTSTVAHEMSHGIGSSEGEYVTDKKLGLNPNEARQLQSRNKLSALNLADMDIGNALHIAHDRNPGEVKADMDALRYQLYKDKIYNTGTQPFTPQVLQKAKAKYQSNNVLNRLFTNYKDKDLIYLMNNIAMNQGPGSETPQAADGAQLSGGGDPTNPPIRRLQPTEMQQWNGYLDFVKQKGYEGSKELNAKNKGLGESLFNQYKAANKDVTIDYSIVPSVQNEMQQLRNTTQDFLSRKGLPGADKVMNGVSKVDGWMGSQTSQFRFPEATLVQDVNGKAVHQQSLGLVDSNLQSEKNPIPKTVLPKGVTPFQDRNGQWMYEDPQTGDLHPYQMKNGGKLKKAMMENGGIVPKNTPSPLVEVGKTYDLHPDHIRQLLSQGYQLDYR